MATYGSTSYGAGTYSGLPAPTGVDGTSDWRVELGLVAGTDFFVIGTSLLGGPDTLAPQGGYEWTDISAVVNQDSISTATGATRTQGPWWRAEAGRASFTIDNLDGDFDPSNLSSPYVVGGVTPFRPGLPVRISRVSTEFERIVWSGTVDVWNTQYTAGSRMSTVSVSAVDAVEQLQGADLPALGSPVGAGDSAGERINRILDRIGWDANAREIDETADNTMQATTMAQPAWTEILLTADSDAGFVWIDTEGRVVYRRRASIPFAPEATISDDSEATYVLHDTVNLSYDREQIVNSAAISRVDGSVQVVTDEDSAAADRNGYRGYQRTDLICETDAGAAEIAAWLVFQYSDLETRVESVSGMVHDGLEDIVWSAVIDTFTIGRRIRVHYTTPDGREVDQDGIVQGVRWDSLVGGSAAFGVSFQTTPTDISGAFIVGTSLLGGDAQLSPY